MASPSGLELDAAASVRDELAVLETLSADAATDPARRAHGEERLAALRRRYRERPEEFPPEVVSALRSLAEVLRAAAAPTAAQAREVLKTTFGYDAFRPGQEEIVSTVLSGRDCVGVMPTGAGKSLTYQIPARLLGGTTLVISPLIALMKDQVDALTELGVRATLLNSSVPPEERRARIEGLQRGDYELVYATPEGIEASVGSALGSARLSLISVDEAHCISQWGHDFRPAYRNLAGLKRRFGGLPVLALTATATREVRSDIVAQLGMVDPVEVRGSFYRPNLRVHGYKKGDGGPKVREAILALVRARAGSSGIIYCLSRRSAESTAEHLRDHGVRALAYHAGLEPEVRNRVQDAFRRDDVDVVVATVAFGMGIDKPNVRFVIHRDMPRSVEGWYQEIGRAGRDGAPSDCVLFYSWADVIGYDRLTDDAAPEIAARHRHKVREMYELAERGACRHQGVVAYFGERMAPCGGSCDVCTGGDVLKAERGSRRRAPAPAARPVRSFSEDSSEDSVESAGFLRLKALRKRLADERGVPAYLVFSDAALAEMIRRRPRSETELLSISGVGPKKLALYGAAFLAALAEDA